MRSLGRSPAAIYSHSLSGDGAELCIRAIWRAQWPAFAALAIAVGAALFALTYVIALDEFTTQMALLLILALAYAATNSYLTLWRTVAGVTHAPSEKDKNAAQRSPLERSWKHRISHLWHAGGWVVALGFSILAPLSVPLGLTVFIPSDIAADSNLLVATIMGWVTLGSIFIVRAMIGKLFGSTKPLPLATPLLPGLSLFGLLHIISVDTPVMLAFLIYIAAAIYLVSFENFMARREENLIGQMTGEREMSTHFSIGPSALAVTSRRHNVPAQYLAVCGVWMLAFMLGAAAIHYPLSTVLPTSFLVDLTRSRGTGETDTADWRSASRVMELRGGSYPLSDRPVMRVRTDEIVNTGLWRGRVYEQYVSDNTGPSHWEVFMPSDEETYREMNMERRAWNDARALPANTPAQVRNGLQRSLPTLKPEQGKRSIVTETFDPLSNFAAGPAVPLYTAGEAMQLRGSYNSFIVRTDGTMRLVQPYTRARAFSVRSAMMEPNLAALNRAPGLKDTELAAWRGATFLRPSLELPENASAQSILRALAKQILAQSKAEGRSVDTPHQKALVVGQYLISNCEYSLASMAVPAGEDGTVFFLTTSKQGACDMFASAMALLMRAMDVPTRIATGFRQPETPDDEAGLIHTVRERDAHAWVEYYVPEFGWMRFDPTDGSREADTSLGAQMLQLMKLPSLLSQRQNLYLPAAGALLLLIGIVWTLLDKYAAHRSVAKHESSISEVDMARRRVIQTYGEARKLLAHRVPARPGHTALEYENIVMTSPLSNEAKQEFAALTYLMLDARYGPHAGSARNIEQADLDNMMKRLKQSLKTRKTGSDKVH